MIHFPQSQDLLTSFINKSINRQLQRITSCIQNQNLTEYAVAVEYEVFAKFPSYDGMESSIKIFKKIYL